MSKKKQVTAVGLTNRIYKPADSPVNAGGGLFLQVSKEGHYSWLVRFTNREGKRSKLIIGDFAQQHNEAAIPPQHSLYTAQAKANEVKLLAKAGQEPQGIQAIAREFRYNFTQEQLEAARQAKDAIKRSFAVVATRWMKEEYSRTKAQATITKARAILKMHLLPYISDLDTGILNTNDVRHIIMELAKMRPSTANTCKQIVNMVLDFACRHEIRDSNLSQIVFTREESKILTKSKPLPAATNVRDLQRVMQAIHGYEGFVVKQALLFMAYVVARPGVIASAKWEEMDFERSCWIIPGHEPETYYENGIPIRRMKMGIDHIIPLSHQALTVLDNMKAISGNGNFIFPAQNYGRNGHLNRDSLSKALRESVGAGKHVTHGFRASFRTLCREELNISSDVLEKQLAHANGEKSYDRTTLFKQRVKALQQWGDYLEGLMHGQRNYLQVA